MATKAKRATKATKTTKSTKTASRPTVTKAARAKVSKISAKTSATAAKLKQAASRAFWLRTRFLFYVVLIAAALVAISVGLMSYQAAKTTGTTSTDTTGVLFLQSLDGDKANTVGQTVEVTLYEDSGKQAVNALQASVKYPAEQLEFISVKTGSAFPQDAATDTATPGLIRVARSIKPGTSSVKGAKPIVTITFKVLKESNDPYELTIDDSASLLVRSSDNQNILGSNPSNKFNL